MRYRYKPKDWNHFGVMVTRSRFVYSAAAVRRLMGLPASAPLQMREFLDVIWVWVKGDRPTFVSKTDLKRHFVERRKADAQALQVVDWLRTPGRYTVTNSVNGSEHLVRELRDRLDCDCEDYRWQQQFIGGGCCKHGYAVLNYLGFDSLRSYLAAGAEAKPAKLEPAQLPRQLTLSL